ncbi:MAG TPA: 2-oxo-4-hydroxy-4-carboxy-5-ureidoimidazoline decarboxylase [Xanthobacteraceae bacterium]|jgi:2-oxo-4-hydroxy-4-carboxy-5-ureidoimidazoline decarboxylase|nr:2-oxo-4-hydroxy-4-carboxy-5-ureidoimidazoline decarboxylase [Xanthobacteraceae bacterium]
MTHITLEELNHMDRDAFVAALGEVFEHAPWVAENAFAAKPFAGVHVLYDAMISAVRNADNDRQMALIKGHPDLAGKAALAGEITDDSKREQSSAGLDLLSDDEFANFHRLNDTYHKKFDIPFIVCVRRHGKDSILRQFEKRLGNDTAAEHKAALDEIFRIVALRLDQRVAGADRLKVSGRISTHVLDTQRGQPAQGVAIELFEVGASGTARSVAKAVTNADGRTDKPLIAEQPIPIAQYELHFDVGSYFARLNTPVTDPPFLGVVPIRFSVSDPEGHYHVPIIVTPWSYSTYRGS